MHALTTVMAEMIERQLRERMKQYCSVADTCPHIGRNECAECAQNSLKVGRSKGEKIEAEV